MNDNENTASTSPAPAAPPQILAALEHFGRSLSQSEGRPVDPMAAPWDEIERGVIKLMGGPFAPENPGHRDIAFMVAATLSEKLRRDLGAFWFPNRSAPQGAAMGFPTTLAVVSPFDAAAAALGRSRLALLDELTGNLTRATQNPNNPAPPVAEGSAGLGPAEYRRLFDPGFVQFLTVDAKAARAAWERRTDELIVEFEHAFERLPREVPEEARGPLREQILGALRQLDGTKPLLAHALDAPQIVELVTLLMASRERTGFAPAEFWEDVLLPLLHVGPTEIFPPLDDEEAEPFKQGAEPVIVYVDVMPWKTPSADEDGLLGVFPSEDVLLLDRGFADVPTLRMARVPVETLAPLFGSFDPAAIRKSVDRFAEMLREKTGRTAEANPPPPSGPGFQHPRTLLDVALMLLGDLAGVIKEAPEGEAFFCIRRAPEAEAATEPLLSEVRKALTAPRIIMP